MKRRVSVDPVLAIALGVTAAVIALYALAVSAAFSRASETIPVPSVFSSAPQGLRVLYRYLDESGVDVRLLQQFDELPPSGCIAIVGDAPLQVEFTDEQLASLAEWVRSGGTVVLAGSSGGRVVESLGLTAVLVRGEAAEIAPRVRTPLAEGVDRVSVQTGRVLADDPRWVVVAGDDAGAVLVAAAVDRGEVVWLADADALANEHIAEADNARVALRIFAASQPVWFDEYHQGFARGGSAFQRLGPSGQAAFVLAALGVGLLLLSASRRTGPPVPAPEEKRARTLAYIDSLAGLYRRAGAHREALATLRDGLARALARRYGSPAAGLRRHPAAAEALARADEALGRDTIPEDEFREAARLVVAARREVER
ncbi:DUF4350 domain-containing protein [Coriobacteriia bacterium Es71-Z0120]|uniref:DUF4350 domain-containing protein n=1 Tax=Parvivirga hydrogeniphila TaxID=2939460 RepID=UPI0022609E2D|nr:DUF4350 domain-containing protein [Parvivirga hydrogeniphila]MCL4079396.1 DUF4350 domain-containing protein [Parvivirga hydrogeniphila]